METSFFENTQYKNKYTKKSLIIDISLRGNIINYNVVLPEELKVDKFSEVFVDTVITNNIVVNTNINNLVKFAIGTGNISNGMGIQQCWSKFVYNSDGSKTPKIVCY